ncbi:SMP-30/gluconolactonase/LRE family protein [Stenotrophomonas tumulicola]|uniref:SMP-30/gluconolactonase/LRE family protein n=1 Tax=Stenotrophomonas tumulicola TaxID=1685415 RepID=A0A7W3FIM3_9GAMM|nr:SMP-30/gluconolactonase/LRE family protein [Stenotrophomonas tumulicola]
MSARATLAVPAGNQLGEGVLWCVREQALYWTDIAAAQLWRHHPAEGTTRRWPMPERLAAIALCEAEGWLLLALASRLAFFHPGRNELRELHRIDTSAGTRANDGACDRQGRFVFGMLHEPAQGPKQAVGRFHRLHADLSLETLPLPPAAIANGIAFSPDGSTMYFCDSQQKVLQRCDYGNTLGPAMPFADLRGEDGEPDGSAVDAEGGVWNARWGATRVVRYLPDGREDIHLSTPTTQPTRPAFGGPGLTTLFVTSAHDGMDAATRTHDPHAGDLFAFVPGVAGLPEPRFAGNPDALPPR